MTITEAGKHSTKPHIRWMIRRDMPEVMAIENECFPLPWEEDDFLRYLRQRNAIGMVVELDDRVVGFMIYELHKGRLQLTTMAVAKGFQGQGVGSQMIEKLVGKLNPQRRTKILAEVRETNLPAQLFLKANGFMAISVLREFFEDTGEDAYLMQYKIDLT